MWTRLDNALFFLCSAPAILRASWRLWGLGSDRRLDELADDMRRVTPFRHAYLADPHRLAACTQRWLTWWSRCRFKPSKGDCLERSLLLLDLWTRCGLQPDLRLGAVFEPQHRHFHAWVTTADGPKSGNSPHQVIWVG